MNPLKDLLLKNKFFISNTYQVEDGDTFISIYPRIFNSALDGFSGTIIRRRRNKSTRNPPGVRTYSQ